MREAVTLPVATALIAIGFAIAGLLGVVVVCFWLARALLVKRPGIAVGAAALLAIAGLATAAQGFLERAPIGLDYATQRPLAATLAAMAGVSLLVELVLRAFAERSTEPTRPVAHHSTVDKTLAIPAVVVCLASALIGGIARLGSGGSRERALVQQLRAGLGYPAGAGDATAGGPIGPLLKSFFPVSGVVLDAVAVAVAGVALWFMARQLGQRGAATVVALAGVVLTLAMRADLNAVLVLSLTAATIAAVAPPNPSIRRVVSSALLIGLAALAQPIAATVGLGVGSWLAHSRRRERPQLLIAFALAAASSVGAALALLDRTGNWTGMVSARQTAAWAVPLGTAILLSVSWGGRVRTASE